MSDFTVVFEKLKELTTEEQTTIKILEANTRELDEIEELRRFSADLLEPEPTSFTTT